MKSVGVRKMLVIDGISLCMYVYYVYCKMEKYRDEVVEPSTFIS